MGVLVAGMVDIDRQAIASGQGLGEWSPGAAWGTPTAFIGMSFGPAGVEGLQWGEVNGIYRGWNNWNLSTGPNSPFWEQPGTVVSFYSDGMFAQSIVSVGDAIVTHVYRPFAIPISSYPDPEEVSYVSPYLYEAVVTIQGGDGYYSRTLNWTARYASVEGLGETVGGMTTSAYLNGEYLSGDTESYEDFEGLGEGQYESQHTTTFSVQYDSDQTGQGSFSFVFGMAETISELREAFVKAGVGSAIYVASGASFDPITQEITGPAGWAGGIALQVSRVRTLTPANPNAAGAARTNRVQMPLAPATVNYDFNVFDPSGRGGPPAAAFGTYARFEPAGGGLVNANALFTVNVTVLAPLSYRATIGVVGAPPPGNYVIGVVLPNESVLHIWVAV